MAQIQEQSAPQSEYVLELHQICKAFTGVRALHNIDFTLKAGEVHVLLGENGAGKSTLIKILTGAYQLDSGTIKLSGNPVEITDAIAAQNFGISAVYQEFNLIPQLDAGMNIFLHNPALKGKFIRRIDRNTIYKKSKELIHSLGVDLDVTVPVNKLSVSYQQIVEIAKALALNAKILIFDEPTASITEEETQRLLKIILRLKEQGTGIIYISHRLEDIYQIGDRATILRDGEYVDTVDLKNEPADMDSIIKKMVGRNLEDKFPKVHMEVTDELLRVENISCTGKFEGMNFSLYRGEILGIAGLVGAGRTEVAKAIFGEYPITSGKIYLMGKQVSIRSPSDAIKMGITLAPEDRRNEGLVQLLSIRQNIIMPSESRYSSNGVLKLKKIKAVCDNMVSRMRISTNSLEKQVRYLSGGNQQKVVLAKWMVANSKIMILDEPTRGIDVGAKVEVYHLLNEMVQSGIGILIISSELPEVLGMCDRIIVMHEGRQKVILKRQEATQELILRYATNQEEI